MGYLARLSACTFAAVTAIFCGTSAAFAEFPERAVEFVISTSPGGGHDGYVRMIAARLQAKWGKPVVVLNKPGASVTIAEGYVANALPDGHTVLFVNSQRSINAAIGATNAGYDSVNAFAPITLSGKQPQILVAKKSLPVKTLPDLVKMAKAAPGKLNYGDYGLNSGADLAMKLLMKKADINLMQISYKSTAETMTALLSGEIDVGFGNLITIRPQIEAGHVIALALTDDVRSPAMPNLPTAKEQLGLDSFVNTSWYGVFVPARTPKDIVKKLNEEIVAVLNLPEVRQPLEREGLEVVANKPEEFEKIVNDEIANWRSVIKK